MMKLKNILWVRIKPLGNKGPRRIRNFVMQLPNFEFHAWLTPKLVHYHLICYNQCKLKSVRGITETEKQCNEARLV